MKNQLIPPPELAPPSVRHLSCKEKVEIWAALVDDVDELVLASFRERLGADGDAEKAFLEWLDRQMVEHDHQALYHMIRELRRRERAYQERLDLAGGKAD